MQMYGKHSHNDNKERDHLSKSVNNRSREFLPERAGLSSFRVIQRDLVYVIGISSKIANEETLKQYEYFGQYGQIKKIVVNNQSQRPTVSAYITFYNNEDAIECIYAIEDFVYCNYPMKASFGTSKYCSNYLSGVKCNNSDCMYLHYKGDPNDSFNAEEIQQNSPRFIKMTRPTRPDNYFDYEFQDDKPTQFPFRRILSKQKSQKNNQNPQQTTQKEIKNQQEEMPDVIDIYQHLTVNYQTTDSLENQYRLSSPTIRSIFEKIET